VEVKLWAARIFAVAYAAVAVFFAIPEGFHDVFKAHHYFVLVPLAMWIVLPPTILFAVFFRWDSWPPRST
jgi:hypothetical protein